VILPKLGLLFFIIYINDIGRVTDLGEFVLLAEDTSIFVFLVFGI
jgi:hypothetical protein